MRINKIKLENIRSYVSQEIIFPEGKVLLWGNIGSGKSSILHAIDFALFGLQRSELAGASLLRNGTDEGTVELFFSIDEKDYVIKRTLKRSKSAVTQDAGYIIRNGIKEEKTAIELKQIVLELLHYPKDLITKNKTLIYRYTVYTPQEEMKTILLGSKEERLDTLRKVFAVDKYKRIKENVKIIVSDMKEKKKLYEGATVDIQEKIIDKEKKSQEKIILEKKLTEILIPLEELSKMVQTKKEELILLEGKREEILKEKRELFLWEIECKNKLKEKEETEQKISLLQQEIVILEKENLETPDVKESLSKGNELLTGKEKELREILNKIQDCKTRKAHALLIKQKVESLEKCPTCQQKVSPEHKHNIIEKTNAETQNHDSEIAILEKNQQTREEEMRDLRGEIDLLRKKESEAAINLMKKQQLLKKRGECFELMEKLTGNKKSQEELNTKIAEAKEKQKDTETLEILYIANKQEAEQLQNKYHTLNLEKATVTATLNHYTQTLNQLTEEIQKKLILREKKEYLNKIQFWLTDSFTPLLDTMEKNILFKVHAEFNSLFEKWFSILIDNQSLQMSLDEDYSPKILQNDYDIEYEYLSGGEKTAGALAYRLALNQVINNMNTGIKTNDLLILDEPTDGFSHEQLDRLKILMEEINIPQIILVSHEAQIECFADHILRFEKQNHITSLVS
ncbi:AAA family ATPase [Candidatus Woesearchaeota archaeon]|nr:AAA family ATPase [Candidatus Woesearchaeota archaeon]